VIQYDVTTGRLSCLGCNMERPLQLPLPRVGGQVAVFMLEQASFAATLLDFKKQHERLCEVPVSWKTEIQP